ncbi:7-cyano-7-deazaguanine synthase QueC [Candidatus Venteria ishoeyi]|uniref:7-cyano-7-deazaguanine synthase n=1 Tax=Candidatus Venteria ishoeyi TaxID=1899563 RepID=A0A1H6FHF5_9GAMM|nr:7-cyano-7-deazaguanine synthase QueC [Candidatus Venteria ishoeyi]MDM8546699.1 7-cyano-7-deazaguanine synthase QueC [Candidatus Venteria ishoeyi]SEH08586.1 7-cyano-7-deazaguanine synthase [Candidatus Venteria ishoeyi]
MSHEVSATGKNAIVLLSGGLDSTTVLAIAKVQGFQVYALSFSYGQRHQQELECARHIAKQQNVVEHRTAQLDLALFGGSALTDDIEVPKTAAAQQIGQKIPITYVPARNTIFLSYALAWAEVLPAQDIFIGVNALDFSGYPDCRPDYIAAFEHMANLATRLGTESGMPLKIHTPLIKLSKAQIIQQGLELGVDYGQTSTCYAPQADGKPCGECEACRLRQRGFKQLGLSDPLLS